ncbi:hypothetical protein M422DRAFT_27468 [Sphaerobolus stellatus SS14]|nr:hypothetical protein M422DRAFT_27468 [Sphaerobolus stellatus SS14]
MVCAAGPAPYVNKLVSLAAERGWAVQLIATPNAIQMLDSDNLHKLTGRAILSGPGQRDHGGTKPTYSTTALIIASATFNTIGKLAHGISDNHALDMAHRLIGEGVPIAVIPFVNTSLASRIFRDNIQKLRDNGISVIFDAEDFRPHPPGKGEAMFDSFPWHVGLKLVEVVQPDN